MKIRKIVLPKIEVSGVELSEREVGMIAFTVALLFAALISFGVVQPVRGALPSSAAGHSGQAN